MNWRKPLIYCLLRASGNKIPKILKEIESFEYAGADVIREMTDRKLKRILLHAYTNVPYYRRILGNCGVVSGGEVKLDNFSKIPLLTKEIIQEESENLLSEDYKSRKRYDNTSGGSTGEPARFVQDAEYDEWNIATKLYFNAVLGKQPGQAELKLWGSDRDIIEGNLTAKDRLINFLFNRKFFNSYRFDDDHIERLVAMNNRHKPVAYWSYMESAFELANFLLRSKVHFHPPEIVISTIGPLTDEVKDRIEAGMKCRAYNQYGSREVGGIACQCKEQAGLHTFPWWNYVELLNDKGQAVDEGEGNVVVTTFHNFSMPLIRYDLGDVAVPGGSECRCGRNTFLLKKVMGRTLGYFRKSDRSLVHSHFIVQALFFRDWIKKFQAIQDELDHILIRVELRGEQKAPKEDIDDIIKKVKMLMGESCRVDFDFVESISRTGSGKYLYTICEVK